MNDLDIRDMCRDLAAFDWDKLADRLCRLNQRDRAGTVVPDGYKTRTLSGDIPANDPEALTPVERAADARAFGKLEPDEVHRANVHALSALGQAHLAAGSVVDHLRRGEKEQRWEKPVGQTSTPCKVGPCDSPASKNGFCDTDNRFNLRYIEQHNEPAPIGLLEENARKRQPQKRRQSA